MEPKVVFRVCRILISLQMCRKLCPHSPLYTLYYTFVSIRNLILLQKKKKYFTIICENENVKYFCYSNWIQVENMIFLCL